MNKHSSDQHLSALNNSFLDNHPVTEWFEKNGLKLLYALLAFAALLILLYRYSSNKSSEAEKDYFQAANAIVMMKNPAKSGEALTELKAIFAKHPELQPRYDGAITENLIIQGQMEEASLFADDVFKRVVGNLSPFYLSFSKNTLTIASHQLEEGLKNARLLKDEMMLFFKEHPQEKRFGPRLYLFNLLRIGMLSKELNLIDEANAAWAELFQMNEGTHPLPMNKADISKAIKHMEEQGVSLKDFVQTLKK